jgi:16S rRNA (guanine1207-N2)-methyltransferase
VVYRVSKERPVVHYLLNQLAAHHQNWDTLILIGQKNDGIKSYADHACSLFGNKHLKKHGNHYLATIAAAAPQAPALDCLDYPTLRTTCHWQEIPLQAKPGTFGWQKVDDGSRFLIEQFPLWSAHVAQPPKRILDLGCGYGFISVAAHTLLPQADICWLATDNCAAALSAVQRNCGNWADSFAGDRGLDAQGAPLRAPVDLILCNPPFHQGFSPSGDITEKFVHAMHRWLVPGGQALVVVNQFVGLEKRARGLFRQIKEIANNGSFKVLALSK